MIENLSLVRLPDLTPIPWTQLGISWDIDSDDWQLRATIIGDEALDLVRPGLDPVEVRAVLNGYPFDFVLKDDGSSSQEFGSSQGQVTGGSLVRCLDDPYAPSRDRVQPALRTARQLAEEEIEGLGYALDWGIVDWVVRGGVWSYQNRTPLGALKRIAAAAGGYVVDVPATKTLQVRYRYPIPPWEWPITTPAVVLGDADIRAVTLSRRRTASYNRVVVSGGQTGKTRVVATRSGSAGNISKDIEAESLICSLDVGRERARQELCHSGAHADFVLHDILVPPAPEPPGILQPNALVEVRWRGEQWRGQVIGIDIAASFGTLAQSITVERFYG